MSARSASLVFSLSFALVSCSRDNEPPKAASADGGPLATLETSMPIEERWTTNRGQEAALLYFPQQNLRISAGCRQPNGKLACDALRQVREGMPVGLTARDLSSGVSAGTKACVKLGQKLVNVRNSAQAEDGMCLFADGSMISTGALELYGTRVLP